MTPTGPAINPNEVLNINVGVLGHVDSGKTSLTKRLSTLLSTASLDKSAQSRQRGITLDLGFSAFFLDEIPPQIANSEFFKNKDISGNINKIQITLVDCPGHASLIRTIIGGAQIIDMMILVVDATKGIQTQTAECLVIAEMTTKNLIVALNKIDLFSEDERLDKVRQVEARLRLALRHTRFWNAPMVGISACIGGEKMAAVVGDVASERRKGGTGSDQLSTSNMSTNIDGLLKLVKTHIQPPNRNTSKTSQPFLFAIDHCFPIKGQGTVLTGTVLSGMAKINDMIHFPELGIERKIKSMQMFRRPVQQIYQGDRSGICVANLDAKLIERGVASSPGSVSLVCSAIAVVRKVKYFHGKLQSNSKFHISVGHNTVMASVTFFGGKELSSKPFSTIDDGNVEEGPSASLSGGNISGLPRLKFDFNNDFLFQDELMEDVEEVKDSVSSIDNVDKKRNLKQSELPLNFAILNFQTPVFCPSNSLIIGSRLDTDINANTCRLAFSGRLIQRFDPERDYGKLKFYSWKEREAVVCRLGDPYKRQCDDKIVRYEIYGTDLFKKETNMAQFVGLKMQTMSGDIGVIHSSFGTSGKFRVNFPAGTDVQDGEKLFLRFKRYANDKSKAMHQDINLPNSLPGVLIVPELKESKKSKSKKKNKQTSQEGNVRPLDTSQLGTISLEGEIVSVKPDNIVIVAGFFSPEVNIREKVGWKVEVTNSGEIGSITAPFGKAGKCKVSFSSCSSLLSEGTKVRLLKNIDEE